MKTNNTKQNIKKENVINIVIVPCVPLIYDICLSPHQWLLYWILMNFMFVHTYVSLCNHSLYICLLISNIVNFFDVVTFYIHDMILYLDM